MTNRRGTAAGGRAIAGRGDRRDRVDRGRPDALDEQIGVPLADGVEGAAVRRRGRDARRCVGERRQRRSGGRAGDQPIVDEDGDRRSGPRRRAPRRSARRGDALRRARRGAGRRRRQSARRWRDMARRRRGSPGRTRRSRRPRRRSRRVPAGQPGALGPALTTTRPSRPTTARPSDRSSAAIRSISTRSASSSWRATASTPNARCSWYDSRTVLTVGLLEIRLARSSASRWRSRCETASCRCAAARSPAMPRSTTPRVSSTSTTEIAPSTPTTVAKAIATTRTTKRGAGDGDSGGAAAPAGRNRDRQDMRSGNRPRARRSAGPELPGVHAAAQVSRRRTAPRVRASGRRGRAAAAGVVASARPRAASISRTTPG